MSQPSRNVSESLASRPTLWYRVSRRQFSAIAADPVWTPDLAVFSALLFLTAAFGRPFSKIHVPGAPIYITEIALAVVVILLTRRMGVRGVVARVRDLGTLPVLLLLLLWIAGAIATLRGLATYGFNSVTHDVALIEYSVVVPIVAAAADTPARRLLVFRVLVAAGLAAAVVFTFVYFIQALAESRIGLRENAGAPVGLYVALFVLPVLVGWVERGRSPRWMLAAAGGALVLISLTVQRSVILALVASLVVVTTLARRKRHVFAASVAIAAVAVSVAGAMAIQKLDIGTTPPGVAPSELAGSVVSAAQGYVADDAGTAFRGGLIVRGDAAVGDSSRQITRDDSAELLEVRGLVPGTIYTIVFWVKPLEPVVAHGGIGDIWGNGWKPRRWIAAPSVRWQRFQKQLRATRSDERLAIALWKGPTTLRFDGVEIVPRKLMGPPGDYVPHPSRQRASRPEPPPGGRVETEQTKTETEQPKVKIETEQPKIETDQPKVEIEQPRGENPLIAAIRGTFDRNSLAGGFNENMRWRLAFWRYMLHRSARHPVAGVGFGMPADFVWRGVHYDARRDESDVNDVTPPHNSFVNLIFRTGLLGGIPFFVLLGIAITRLGRALRSASTPEERRRLVSLAAIGAFIVVVAGFNGVLEGPFMGIFYWVVLGLLLLSDGVDTSVVQHAVPPAGSAAEPAPTGIGAHHRALVYRRPL